MHRSHSSQVSKGSMGTGTNMGDTPHSRWDTVDGTPCLGRGRRLQGGSCPGLRLLKGRYSIGSILLVGTVLDDDG